METGFKNPMRVCCGYGGGQYNFNSSFQCGGKDFQVCDEVSEYVNWDGTHYTDSANKFVATKILSTCYSTPQVALADLFLSDLLLNHTHFSSYATTTAP